MTDMKIFCFDLQITQYIAAVPFDKKHQKGYFYCCSSKNSEDITEYMCCNVKRYKIRRQVKKEKEGERESRKYAKIDRGER